ncbi:MAG: hypothetical protein V1834_01000 [Candidatus Micrarchaeota archaeon]
MNMIDVVVIAAFILIDDLRIVFFALLESADPITLVVLLLVVVYARNIDFSSLSDKFFGGAKAG